MSYKRGEFIVSTGERWIYVGLQSDVLQYVGRNETRSGWLKISCYLADTSERTSPAIAHTRHREEAVRLSKGEAAAEALQVKGKVIKV